jgi:lipopolysaccharide/colanic/teichoic acid biosynthesis glycosyltransferase
MLGVHRFGLSRSSRLVKRATDVAGALLALFMVAPIMGIFALLIKLDSPGPVFFRQLRVGRNGQPFEMIKFRSMRPGADEEKAELERLNQAGDGMFKVSADPRITRVGRLLRRYSLDELPQLLNVLHGEMSLVGPRPLVLDEDKRIEGWHRRRLHLTPGMTGPWQVLGDTRVPLRDMVGIDYLYAANWSLWTDAKVLARTVGHVLAGRGL